MNNRSLRLFQIFSAKLVLEVFGGAGAIWGCSEALGLRNTTTEWFWRPCALSFGAIFFVRWLLQIQHYIVQTRTKMMLSFVKDSGESLELTAEHDEGSSYGSREELPSVIV